MFLLILLTIISCISLSIKGSVAFLIIFAIYNYFKISKKENLYIPFLFFILPFSSFIDLNLIFPVCGLALCYNESSITKKNRKEIPCMPFFVLFLFVMFFIQFFDVITINFPYIIKRYKILGVLHYIDSRNRFCQNALYIFLFYFSYLLFYFLSKNEEQRKVSLKFLKAGVCVSLFIFLLEFFLPQSYFNGMNDYFKNENRLSGSFSDPNIAGLFYGFIIIIFSSLFKKEEKGKNILNFIFILLCFVFASFTGSKSFYLILISYFLFLYFLKERKKFLKLIFLLGFLYILYNISYYYWGNSLASLDFPAKRVLDGAYVLNLNETSSSRYYFLTSSLYAFKENFLLGIGLNNFYDYFPFISSKLRFNTGIWQDSNLNFYLQILSEGGIFFLIILILSFLNVRLKKESNECQISCLFALLFILLFFNLEKEILVLSTLIFSYCFYIKRQEKNSLRYKFINAFSFILIIFYGFFSFNELNKNKGFYNFENERGKVSFWTSKSASFYLACKNKKATFKYAVIRPKDSFYPIKVNINEEEAEVLNRKKRTKVLECKDYKNEIKVNIKLDKAWLQKSKKDPRLLGAKIYIDNINDMTYKN